MPEIPIEDLTIAKNIYSRERTLSHLGVSADSYHATRADAMKKMLEALGLLDDQANHDIVKKAREEAESKKMKSKRSK